MEPGHEDREYLEYKPQPRPREAASMEPGHEDREYLVGDVDAEHRVAGLNGARS